MCIFINFEKNQEVSQKPVATLFFGLKLKPCSTPYFLLKLKLRENLKYLFLKSSNCFAQIVF